MISFFLKTIIRLYQLLLSPFFGRVCRFEISCSNNMLACLNRLGLVVGFYFGLRQLFLCNPWFGINQTQGIK